MRQKYYELGGEVIHLDRMVKEEKR